MDSHIIIISTVLSGVGVLITLLGFLEVIRRDLRAEIRDVRQASETAHKEIQTRLSSVETQLATITERVDCVNAFANRIDGKIDGIQRQLMDTK